MSRAKPELSEIHYELPNGLDDNVTYFLINV